MIILAGLGWLYLALLSAAGRTGSFGSFELVQALCGTLQDGFAGPYAAAVVFSMWCAMTLAMMLPSAAPMILTYTEIADTAARKSERIVSPFVLAAGYAVVWFGFSVFAALGQMRIDQGGVARSGHGLGEPAIVRCDFYLRRHLSILGAQACMSYAVPSSISGFLHELGYYACRSIQTRS